MFRSAFTITDFALDQQLTCSSAGNAKRLQFIRNWISEVEDEDEGKREEAERKIKQPLTEVQEQCLSHLRFAASIVGAGPRPPTRPCPVLRGPCADASVRSQDGSRNFSGFFMHPMAHTHTHAHTHNKKLEGARRLSRLHQRLTLSIF